MSIHLVRRRDRGALVEAGLLLGHAALFFVAPFLVMGVWQAIVFVLVTQTAFGFYLGVSFVTNHVGMPVLSATEHLDYLRRQVLTSRNLRRGGVTGFMVGGLDAQIEHHLFPSMPRANLPRARALVRSFCDDESIDYTEATAWQRLLRRVRPPVDDRRPASHTHHRLIPTWRRVGRDPEVQLIWSVVRLDGSRATTIRVISEKKNPRISQPTAWRPFRLAML